METNWFEEGAKAAHHYKQELICWNKGGRMIFEPDCPWPIYSPEGTAWLRGWNSVSLLGDEENPNNPEMRPMNKGHRFYPSDCEIERAEALL